MILGPPDRLHSDRPGNLAVPLDVANTVVYGGRLAPDIESLVGTPDDAQRTRLVSQQRSPFGKLLVVHQFERVLELTEGLLPGARLESTLARYPHIPHRFPGICC